MNYALSTLNIHSSSQMSGRDRPTPESRKTANMTVACRINDAATSPREVAARWTSDSDDSDEDERVCGQPRGAVVGGLNDDAKCLA